MELEPKITLGNLYEVLVQDRFYSNAGVALRLSKQLAGNINIEDEQIQMLMTNCGFPGHLKDATTHHWTLLFLLIFYIKTTKTLTPSSATDLQGYAVKLSDVRDVFRGLKFPFPSLLFEEENANTENFIQSLPKKPYVHVDLVSKTIRTIFYKLDNDATETDKNHICDDDVSTLPAELNSTMEGSTAHESSSRSTKTPAELLALHDRDPDTWTTQRLGDEFYPRATESKSTRRGWACKQLRKAKGLPPRGKK